jgi:hypothetical protein
MFQTLLIHRHVLVKQFLLQAWTGPEAFRRYRLPDFTLSRHLKVVRLSALHTGRVYSPGNLTGIHFCWRLSRPQNYVNKKIPVIPSGIEPAPSVL